MRTEEKEVLLQVKEFVEKYVDPAATDARCGDCTSHGGVWSCPPYDFAPCEYWGRFNTLRLNGTKIYLNEEEKQHPFETLRLAHDQIRGRLLEEEKQHPGSQCLAPGSCHLCPEGCIRRENKPCRKPEEVRYSIESIGGDVVAVAEDLLGIKLLWGKKGRPPKYYTLVSGLLMTEPV